jgi:hypothetical protein
MYVGRGKIVGYSLPLAILMGDRTMSKARPYEDEILKAVRAIPEEALPKVLQLVTLMREECQTSEKELRGFSNTSHERTRRLLASSKTNWAQQLLDERDDRL